MKTTIINNVEVPVIEPAEIKTIITNKKTGQVYADETALKAANIPEEDVKRDVQVIMPSLDLFAKTK
mgnify:FL=1|tara:strand:- start:57 stop:257 length:201 start_codon:yes stop_codon:yes gene_type:complete